MFSKSKNKSGVSSSGAVILPAAPPSIISRDLRMVGDLHSDGEIQIDGGIEGDIRCMSLLIGETADIRGEIVADSVVVHGRLTGQIKAKAVNLAATAHVIGDILHEDLSIETGAFLEGHCKRIIEKPKVEAPAKLTRPDAKPTTVAPKVDATAVNKPAAAAAKAS